MYNVHVERSAGYAGIAFVVISVIGLFLYGIPPLITWPAADIASFVEAKRNLWLFGAWLTLPESAFFMWFIVQLRAYLRMVPGLDDGLPTYMLIAGIGAATVALLTAMLQATLGFRPQDIGLVSVRLLFDTYTMCSVFIFIPLTIMLFAASHSARRHATFPMWLVYLGYLASIGAAIKSLSVFFTAGFMALGGVGSMVFGIAPLMIWLVAVSLVLINLPVSAGSTKAP
jgi:hypothetical protein